MLVCQPVPSQLPVAMVTIVWKGLLTVLSVNQDMLVGIVKVHLDHVIQVRMLAFWFIKYVCMLSVV